MSSGWKYEQLRDTLREEIKSGKYSPGTQLPEELRWEYRAQPQTWQRAMSELIREGMLERRFGARGPVVLSEPGRLISLEFTPEKLKTLTRAMHLLYWENKEMLHEHFDSVERGRLAEICHQTRNRSGEY